MLFGVKTTSFGGQLEKAFEARAGVFRTLPFVAVRQQQNNAGRQVPFVFRGGNKLIDDDLRAVDEVSELRFPGDQRFRIIAAVAILEAQDTRFR
jgi:hypothetical protein